jgi:hypothetical protein
VPVIVVQAAEEQDADATIEEAEEEELAATALGQVFQRQYRQLPNFSRASQRT